MVDIEAAATLLQGTEYGGISRYSKVANDLSVAVYSNQAREVPGSPPRALSPDPGTVVRLADNSCAVIGFVRVAEHSRPVKGLAVDAFPTSGEPPDTCLPLPGDANRPETVYADIV